MNLTLLDPFSSEFPETIEYTLNHDSVSICTFNRSGTLLASGCHGGLCNIWDLDTRDIACSLIGHVSTITHISWSQSERYLLTSSMDWNCIIWDLSDGSKVSIFRFSSAVISAAMHPRNSDIIIVCPQNDFPVIITPKNNKKGFRDGERRTKLLIPESSTEHVQDWDTLLGANHPQFIQTTATAFDHSGEFIYFGNHRGTISVVNSQTLEVCMTFKSSSGIKEFQFSRNGSELLVSSQDKIIRCFSVIKDENNGIDLDLQHKFQDSVDLNKWSQCCFSNDAEYVLGGKSLLDACIYTFNLIFMTGSAAKHTHKIYIWEKTSGALIKMLEGPKEGLLGLSLHPFRPLIASISAFGCIYVWSVKVHENWSAFAPDFREFQENIEYEEREDEFDILEEDQDKAIKQDQVGNDESDFIDVVTIQKIHSMDTVEGGFILRPSLY